MSQQCSGPGEDRYWLRLGLDEEQAHALQAAVAAVLKQIPKTHPGHEPLTRTYQALNFAIQLRERSAARR